MINYYTHSIMYVHRLYYPMLSCDKKMLSASGKCYGNMSRNNDVVSVWAFALSVSTSIKKIWGIVVSPHLNDIAIVRRVFTFV